MDSFQVKRSKENMPIGSWLLPREFRDDIMAFYQFARYADDIADDPLLPGNEKLRRLNALEAITPAHAPEPLEDYARRLANGRLHKHHGARLVSAFRMDVAKTRYTDWDDLQSYCLLSTAPVGHAILDMFRERRTGREASDALCVALQVINHLQDLREDYLIRGRIYLPQNWLADFHVPESDLGKTHCSFRLRQVIDRALDKTEQLLHKAAPLHASVTHPLLKWEVAIIHAIAIRLCEKLRNEDPLAKRVSLTKREKAACFARGMLFAPKQPNPRAGLHEVARRSSFYIPMVLTRADKRKALLALYVFCRQMDQAIDHAEAQEAEDVLQLFADDIARLYTEERPRLHSTRVLKPYMQQFDLKRDYLEGLLEGFRMDIDQRMLRPSEEELTTYCDAVASNVGRLAIQIWGCHNPRTLAFAEELGQAMQRINIIRDVTEDAERGCIYIPRNLLEQAGLMDESPMQLARHPRLNQVLERLADQARKHGQQALALVSGAERAKLQPAVMMYRIYLAKLNLMQRHGWHHRPSRVALMIEMARLRI